jgi:hypothetical protein
MQMATKAINFDAVRDERNNAVAYAEIVMTMDDVTGTARELALTMACGVYRNQFPNSPVAIAHELRDYSGPCVNAVRDMVTAVLKWDAEVYPK